MIPITACGTDQTRSAGTGIAPTTLLRRHLRVSLEAQDTRHCSGNAENQNNSTK
jgi:hypothetical protein